MIAFECKQWTGDYWSKDRANGVDTSPSTSAIFVVKNTPHAPLQQIPIDTPNPCAPQYSPDGQWIYFQAKKNNHWHIFRCRLDGSETMNITQTHTPNGDRFGYRFSQDGTKILFTYNNGQIGRVGIMEPTGANPKLVAPELGYHYMSDISPDNQSVVFAHTEKSYTLLLKQLDTGALKALTPELKSCFVPQFTPNGQTIVFMRRGGDIYRVDTNGHRLQRLTEGNNYDTFYLSPNDQHGSTDGPSLSPDGNKIAYMAQKNHVSQLHIMNIDGTHQQQLTSRQTPCGRATFSPNGKQIAFVSWVDKHVQLFVINSHGGTPQQITHIHGAVYQLAWQPSNKTTSHPTHH